MSGASQQIFLFLSFGKFLQSALALLQYPHPSPQALVLLIQPLCLLALVSHLSLDLLHIGPVLIDDLLLHFLLHFDHLLQLLQPLRQSFVLGVDVVIGVLVVDEGFFGEMARVSELTSVLVPGRFQMVFLVVTHLLLELQPLRFDFFYLLRVDLALDLELSLLLLQALLQLAVLALALLVLLPQFLVLILAIRQLLLEVAELAGQFEHLPVLFEGLLVLDLQQALRLLVFGLDFLELIPDEVILFVFREAISLL